MHSREHNSLRRGTSRVSLGSERFTGSTRVGGLRIKGRGHDRMNSSTSHKRTIYQTIPVRTVYGNYNERLNHGGAKHIQVFSAFNKESILSSTVCFHPIYSFIPSFSLARVASIVAGGPGNTGNPASSAGKRDASFGRF
jgi:hypothetical protein